LLLHSETLLTAPLDLIDDHRRDNSHALDERLPRLIRAIRISLRLMIRRN